ncbi:MAG: DUF4349 domain-containing protein [Syntrophomonadaceae bacterium]|nr:DUF4349 domain-containing protein [Syntrophomonadaceae bacterium]
MLKTKDLTRLTPPRYIVILLLMVLAGMVLVLSGCGAKSSTLESGHSSNQNQVAFDSASVPESELAGNTAKAVSLDRKTIQNADINMRVQDVSASVDKIIALVNENNGYTVSSRVYRDNQAISGRLSVKVPQTGLESVLSSIAALGELNDKTITTEDVTEEYYDSQAHLKVLQAKEERLLDLMDQTSTITDIISIENELGKTRSEIEVLSGRLQYLTNATTYSLINITLVQGLPGTIQAPQGTLGKSWQGFISSISGLINFASGTVVFLFTALPWLVLLALLFLLGRYGFRKMRARRREE